MIYFQNNFHKHTPTLQEASDQLSPHVPPSRILSLPSVLSVLGNLSIIGFSQLFVFCLTAYQPWFQPFTNPGEDDNFNSYQGTAVFLLSNFQYIALAIIYSKGGYRVVILY
jgi:cation-transporting ATPase 13A3/4/5